jgi:H+-transporting ATPase
MQDLLDIEKGLDPSQVLERLNKYGYNEIPSKKSNQILLFLKKFWGFTPLMLIIAIVLELFIGKDFEAIIITILLFFNSIIAYIQEKKARSALALLKSQLQINSRVKRQGQWILIPAKNLVPDDIIRLRTGDFVPADIIILDGFVEVDQSAITGESLLSEKQINQIIYAGSIIKRGEITGRIKSTAKQTFFGRTINLVEIATPKYYIQIITSRLIKWLILIVILSIGIAIIFALIKKLNILNLLPLFVVLLIASIPIALPTMFTISMALGSLKLSKQGVLVTRLDAIEDAAMVDVICIDKTGTLTLNKLHLSKLISNSKYIDNDILLYGALASHEADQDPIDLAFLTAVKEKNLNYNEYHQKSFIPFDPINRRTEAIIERNSDTFYVTKGAINEIFKIINTSQVSNLNEIKEEVKVLSALNYRLIAVAYGKSRQELELIGIAAIYDQIRPGISNLIEEINELGLSLKMLTGDALPIANEIAKNIGLGKNIVSYSILKRLYEKENIIKLLEEANGFAEIFPEDKYLIVQKLQNSNHIVGMTGDGVNDAPALKQADVGIAVRNATDVAKKASSVVLTKDTLEGIIDLIKVGRIVYQRISIWILNKIVRTFKRVLFIILAFIIFGFSIVSSLDIIILIFLSDFITLSLSTDQVRGSQTPENGNVNNLIKIGTILGILIALEGFLILIIGNSLFTIFSDLNHIHTYTFVFLVYSGYFTILSVREKNHFWNSKPSTFLLSSLIFNSVLVFLISAYGLLGLSPIAIIEIFAILILCFGLCLIFNDFVKCGLLKKL